MAWPHKLILTPVLILAACVSAGLYGMAHDQVSYTVSPDYFHYLKFDQFRIGEHFRNRAGVAFVGWNATWWMGLLVGPPLALVGLILPGPRVYTMSVCKAFALAIATAAATGLLGLLIAIPSNMMNLFPAFRFPEGVTRHEAFLEVGVMHAAGYLGGAVGLIVGIAYLVRTGFKHRRQITDSAR